MHSKVIIICIFDWVFRKLMEYNRHFMLTRASNVLSVPLNHEYRDYILQNIVCHM